MDARVKIKGMWWMRDEGLDESVDRINETFHRLGEIAHAWGDWWRAYKTVADRRRGPLSLVCKPDVIRRELEHGTEQDRGDPRLGYFLTASAGSPGGRGTEMTTFWVRCCSQTPYAGFNDLLLEFPVRDAAPELYDVTLIGRSIAVLADVWDPDWLAAWERLIEVVAPPWIGGPTLGWVNYLAKRTGVLLDPLPRHWRWFEGRGDRQIFIYKGGGTPEPNDPSDISAFQELASHVRWGLPPPAP